MLRAVIPQLQSMSDAHFVVTVQREIGHDDLRRRARVREPFSRRADLAMKLSFAASPEDRWRAEIADSRRGSFRRLRAVHEWQTVPEPPAVEAVIAFVAAAELSVPDVPSMAASALAPHHSG